MYIGNTLLYDCSQHVHGLFFHTREYTRTLVIMSTHPNNIGNIGIEIVCVVYLYTIFFFSVQFLYRSGKKMLVTTFVIVCSAWGTLFDFSYTYAIDAVDWNHQQNSVKQRERKKCK